MKASDQSQQTTKRTVVSSAGLVVRTHTHTHTRTVENVKTPLKRRKLDKTRVDKGAEEKRVSSFHRRSFRTPRTRGHPKTVKPDKAPCNIRQSSPTAHECKQVTNLSKPPNEQYCPALDLDLSNPEGHLLSSLCTAGLKRSNRGSQRTSARQRHGHFLTHARSAFAV